MGDSLTQNMATSIVAGFSTVVLTMVMALLFGVNMLENPLSLLAVMTMGSIVGYILSHPKDARIR